MKKFLWSLIIVSMLGLASCGGGSSDEAKELLSKILQFVGIPHNIVANICQDANRDGICGGGELFTKVTINKGDSIDDIWRKISLTKDGRYFLQTYNPELPILVELQDVAKVNYDDGKFTLAFNGFKTKEDDNETKEISILESMVDANALSKTVADKFRTLTNTEAQDKFYTTLLNDLETNINTLRSNELDKQTAMSATIKEMADETKTNQAQADKINACGNDQTCVDKEIKKISDELIITDSEAEEIKAEQTDETPTTDNNTSTSQKEKFILPNGVMKDEVGESYQERTIPNFIDLSEMSVNVTDTNIKVVMTMVDLPSELVYNRDTNNTMEYVWEIVFRINDNHTVELLADISGNYPDEGEKIGVVSDIIDAGIGINGTGHSYEGININVNGNSIILDVPKSLHQDLSQITSSTKVYFWTQHAYNRNLDDNYYDRYPN